MSGDQLTTDLQHMTAALSLAGRGLGRTAPNPAVGCVLVKDGRVVGRGFTQPGGRPHAEVGALAQAGAQARGATAYVTLEPCAHHGKTPPCADALIAAGISRCVVAVEDSDARVQGRGLSRMREAGIVVETGLCRQEAEDLNAGFFTRVRHGRPLVTLKVATTLDGRIATKTGESKWITGEAARRAGQMLRVRNDAILVGSGTAVLDDPRLDVRLQGLEDASPLRVVMDGRLRLPLTHGLVATATKRATLLMTLEGNDPDRLQAYREAGVEVVTLPKDSQGYIDPGIALRELGNRGITRVLIEGGSHIIGSLFQADLVDRIVWFRAAKIIGGDGISASVGFGLERLELAPRFHLTSVSKRGDDIMESYRRDL
ncbi:bifunctional diaminohydroxyphosphoribosylaminopyrimidine deaminase/5-amino-6-(5-phosphoribosylamino)uracil reductase RibD [Kiloniella laminariae]|uniref:bifunctional diaminohydroxyphosphoribosylaminopyrimidine deaminase/5-amino-6-(5-phosphoribosylamino)uracil reductase RibD n=1 Tax=Kiloniella laminariae TaxID=454162 RepID=UPI0003A5A35A|nr:bifunctional diaminohydroxyphosphoribosylaminopyrimidine deaminase/5-amino-6-(5-phosphoribosylamino)uracil reductase RibD [Kiloniella laminariae]